MRRLRDLVDSEDPAVAELARLVHASSALDPPPGAKDRVRAALTVSAHARPPRRAPMLAAISLALATPGAFAMVHLMQSRDRAPAVMPDLPSALPVPEEPLELRARSFEPLAALPLDAGLAEPRPSNPRDRFAPSTRAVTGPPRAPRQESAPPDASVAAPQSPERAPARSESTALAPGAEPAALVLGALRSLRRDRDALAAIRLLETYRVQFPSGDLAEEALALLVEAFAALHDRKALALADEYLRRFPHGQFRDVAERAVRRFRGGP